MAGGTEAVSPGARRMRATRARRRSGIRRVPVDIHPDVVAAWLERGWLSEEDAEKSAALASAARDLLEVWAAGTLSGDHVVEHGK